MFLADGCTLAAVLMRREPRDCVSGLGWLGTISVTVLSNLL